eukprot:COSAG01_NODE_15437_length_1337_cov_1.771405_1_plen_183_part_00
MQNQRQKLALVAAAALVISSGGLLTRASQVGGRTLYDKFSVTMLSEALKLTIALVRWSHELEATAAVDDDGGPPREGSMNRSRRSLPCGFLTPREAAMFALPAVLYVLVNNLRFPILERVNPGVLSVVWNLKVSGVVGMGVGGGRWRPSCVRCGRFHRGCSCPHPHVLFIKCGRRSWASLGC